MIRTENIKKLSGNESTACFSNGENYTFSTEELCAFHIREGREYTQEEYETLIHNVTVQRAKLIVMPYVIYTKRTEKQVYDKIKSSGYSEEVASALTEELKEKEYIDDRDYCRKYIKKSLDKGDSIQKMLYDLKEKGVSLSVAEEVMQEFSPEDVDQARILLNKKLRTGGKKDYNKLAGYLLRKGFPGGIVRKVLQESDIGRNEEY